jgi:uncharacterized protein (TIGR03382 family)
MLQPQSLSLLTLLGGCLAPVAFAEPIAPDAVVDLTESEQFIWMSPFELEADAGEAEVDDEEEEEEEEEGEGGEGGEGGGEGGEGGGGGGTPQDTGRVDTGLQPPNEKRIKLGCTTAPGPSGSLGLVFFLAWMAFFRRRS